MIKKNKGFTLIEVIFVIIIVGILAVVAIPRLATTRDDAKIANSLAELGALINELGAYYTTKDHFSMNLFDMTDIKDINYTVGWNSIEEKAIIAYYTPNNLGIKEPCVLLSIQNRDGNLTVISVNNPIGNICKGLQGTQAYNKLLGTRYFGGKSVYF